MQADAFADRHTDACACADADSSADIDSDALADRHADACADVDVRACLHALHHARCGPTGTHAQACTMTHAHAHNHGLPGIVSASCSHLRGDRAGTAPVLVHIRAGTEPDVRCD